MADTVLPRRATLADVALRAGVSRATVSLVLRDSPLVAAGTRARVRAAAESVGYLYNRGAATMRGQRSFTVGLLVTEIDNPFFAEFTAGAEAALDEAGYIAFLATTADSTTRQERALLRLREHGVDGIILCPAAGTPCAAVDGSTPGPPLVQAMRHVPGSTGDFAGTANRLGMELLAEHLIASGHRRFAFAGAAVMNSSLRERLDGLEAALRRYGLPSPRLLRSPATRAGGGEAARSLAALPERPDAMVCCNDVVAFGAIPVLERLGLRVGRDVAVTGVGDVPEAATCRPPLTTLDTGPRRIGDAAARLLLRRIADPSLPAERIIAPARLVVRTSCGGQG